MSKFLEPKLSFSFEDVRAAFRAAEISQAYEPIKLILKGLQTPEFIDWSLGEFVELGNWLMRHQLFEHAEQAFAAIRDKWPGDPTGWRGGALVAAHGSRWDICASLWEQSIARTLPDQQQPWWLASLADALDKSGRTNESVALYATLRERWPKEPAGWRGGAIWAMRRGDWAAAAELWKTSLALTPRAEQSLWVWASYADALLKLQKIDNAEAAYVTVRELWPADALGWRGGALVATHQQRWEIAANFWRQSLERTQNGSQQAWWWSAYAEALLKLGNTAEAGRIFAEVRDRWPKDPSGWYGGVKLLAAERRWRFVVQFLDRAANNLSIEEAPDLYFQKVLALLRAGRQHEARSKARELFASLDEDSRSISLQIEFARLSGDTRSILKELLQLPCPAAFKRVPPEQLAWILFDAGLSKSEATRLLATWLDNKDVNLHIDSYYIFKRAGDEELATVLETPQRSGRNLHRWQQLRSSLVNFLRERTYPNFEAFTQLAVNCVDLPSIQKLLQVANKYFPGSRLAIQLSSYLNGEKPSLSWEENAFAFRWRIALPDKSLSIAAQMAGRPWRRLVCALVVRDEDELLPAFMAYYRDLGVESFIIIDNGSVVDPALLLGEGTEGDVTIVRATGDFAQARNGMCWINEILEMNCCDWLLFVDCDEFLVFPGSSAMKLPQLIDHFDSRGETAMQAVMVDVFDSGFASGRSLSSQLNDHRLFTADLRLSGSLSPPWIAASGGIRGLDQFLVKTPLVKASTGVRYIGNHNVSDCRPSVTTSVLKHFKLYRDRVMFSLEPEEVMAHSRVTNRNIWCVSRHVRMAQSGVTPGAAQAFHVNFTADRLLQLGYMTADPAWRSQVPYRLAANRMFPAYPAYRRVAGGPLKEACLTPGELQLREVLQVLGDASADCSRQELRVLLSAQLSRIGRPELALTILLHVAQRLEKVNVVERLLSRLLMLLTQRNADVSVHLVAEVAIALDPTDSATERLLEALLASGEDLPKVRNSLCNIRISRGEYDSSIGILKLGRTPHDEASVQLWLRSLHGLREWENYRATLLSAIEKGLIRPRRHNLGRINIYPHAEGRKELLGYFHKFIESDLNNADGEGLSVFLAAKYLLGFRGEFEELYLRHAARLPTLSRTFFDRVLKLTRGGAASNRAWCVGLSKTGTTSLHEYCMLNGLTSAHWTNPVLLNLLGSQDCDVFDVVSDSTVTFLARSGGVPTGRKVIATTREFSSWSRSFMTHFQRVFGASGLSFGAMQEIVYGEAPMGWGSAWRDIHDELYFRFRTLEEAYEYQHEWLKFLGREHGDDFLALPLESSNAWKAEAVRRLLCVGETLIDYPHANRAVANRR